MEFTTIRYLRGIPGLLKPFGVRIKVDNEAVRIIRFGNIKASILLNSIKDVTVEKGIDWNVIITFEKGGVHSNCVLQVQSFLKERTSNKLANIILTNRQLASENGKARYTKQTSIPKPRENYATGASKIFGVIKTLIITGVALLFLLVIVSILFSPPSSNEENQANEIIKKTEFSSTSPPAKDELVENVQKCLNTLGIKVGKADGIYGPKTKSAIIKFQEEYGLETDGKVSELLLSRLENALTAKISSTKDQAIKQVEKTAESETMVLYDQFNIKSSYGGRQVSKSYFIKESISKVDAKNPNIRQVKTYRKVTDESGATEYKSTFHINCATKQYTFVRHWSTGFGEDKGLFVDGKWSPVSEYADMEALFKQVCSVK